MFDHCSESEIVAKIDRSNQDLGDIIMSSNLTKPITRKIQFRSHDLTYTTLTQCAFYVNRWKAKLTLLQYLIIGAAVIEFSVNSSPSVDNAIM